MQHTVGIPERGELIVALADLFPAADLNTSREQLTLVGRIADFIMEQKGVAFAEGMLVSHAAHELEQDNLQASMGRRVRGAFDAGYTEGYDDGKEGRFHQVHGKE